MSENQTTTERGAGTDENDQPTILVVEDEKAVARAYEMWLSNEYRVLTAHDGEQALEALDETVDVVLLDRQMPNLTGDKALAKIRERGHDCRVAMVTGVDPDFDILEMPFDAYLTKPVDDDDLRNVVEQLLSLSTYDERSHEYFQLVEKKAALEAEKTSEELAASEQYAELTVRLDELESELDELLATGDEDSLGSAFRSFPGGEGS